MVIAPFWADVDIRNGLGGGCIWYREASSEAPALMRARNEIRMAFLDHMDFQPTFLFIATWDSVGYFGQRSSNSLVNELLHALPH